MSYVGEHRLEEQPDRSRLNKPWLVYGAATGMIAANAILGIYHPLDVVSSRKTATDYRDAHSANELEEPSGSTDSLRQHQVSLLVGSIVETIRDRMTDCEMLADKPICYFTTNAYEEPTSVWVTYSSPETQWNSDEQSVHALQVENMDCTVAVTKNSSSAYRTTLRNYNPDTQTVELNPADTPYASAPVNDSDIQCLANISQLLKALPPISSGDEVPTTIGI